MRIIGALLVVIGLILTITMVGAVVGIPVLIIGLLFMIAGRKKTVVVNVHHTPPQ
jgi:hypothetical protein